VTATDAESPIPLMYKITEVTILLRMSRSEVYEQIRAGRIRTVHQGRATFVTADDLAEYVKLLKQEAEAA